MKTDKMLPAPHSKAEFEDRLINEANKSIPQHKSRIVASNLKDVDWKEDHTGSNGHLKESKEFGGKVFDWLEMEDKEGAMRYQMEMKRLQGLAGKVRMVVSGSHAVTGFKHIWATSPYDGTRCLMAVYTDDCKDQLYMVNTETLEKSQLLQEADVQDIYVSKSKEIWLAHHNSKKIVALRDNSQLFQSQHRFKKRYLNEACNTQYCKILAVAEPFLFFIGEIGENPSQTATVICRVNLTSMKEETLSADCRLEALGMSGDHLYALSTDNKLIKIHPSIFKIVQRTQIELEPDSFADIIKGDGETLIIGVQNKSQAKLSLLAVDSRSKYYQREELASVKCRLSSLQFVKSKGARFLLVAAEWKHMHLYGLAGTRIYAIQKDLEVHFTILYGIRPIHELYSQAQDDDSLHFLVHGDYRMKKLVQLVIEL
jgi:hypothetical protein